MGRRVLITGGAGFIGSHLADELLQHGYSVRVLDVLASQVHGPERKRPRYLHPDVELIEGDVRNREAVRRALSDCAIVCHLAAAVGVGQSMYQVADYVSTNCEGTAVLLEALIERPVERLLVASSMSVYGEGLYRDEAGRVYEQVTRDPARLKRSQWDPTTAEGEALSPLPTPETKRCDLASVYALSKFDQERMSLLIGNAYSIPTVALRFFNVYGTRQALSNPYTGVLAIFASRLLNRKPPVIFEDGRQQRDFVHVRDVARACRLALTAPDVAGKVCNVGSGTRITIEEVALQMKRVMNSNVEPSITGKYRVGDIRHCTADITLAHELLGYAPQVKFDQGLLELAEWLDTELAIDRVEEMQQELSQRGLTL